jgi:DNA-binding transcriptional ArsR family regulator
MPVDQLDAIFGALADPTRRAILTRLTQGEASVLELAAPFSVSQPAISRHLKVLERAGLITRTRKATARLSQLRAEPLREATEWLAGYREYWEESYERLDELLSAMQGEGADRSQDPDRRSDPTERSTS